MIMLGIFCIGTRMDVGETGGPLKRDLTQMFKVPEGNDALSASTLIT